VDELLTLGPLESPAVWRVSEEFSEAYNTDILQVWYHSIDVQLVLSHVKFGAVLFISILKNRATHHKHLQLGIENFSKSQVQPPTLFHTPLFFKSGVCGSSFAVHVRVSKINGTYSNE
jgi:hypothetical protein